MDLGHLTRCQNWIFIVLPAQRRERKQNTSTKRKIVVAVYVVCSSSIGSELGCKVVLAISFNHINH